MARRLKLTKLQVVEVNYQYLGAFRLRVEATDPTDSGADPHVFLYLRRPLNPYDETQDDDFHAVASPGDLAEYPVGEPNGLTTYPFFRLDYVELDFRSTEQAEQVWLLIVAEVNALMQGLDRMETLVPVDEVWVGAAPDTGASDSASESDSTSV